MANASIESTSLARPEPAALPLLILLASLLSQYVGAASAKSLFPLVGAEGVTGLRVGLSALMLMAILRPWRSLPGRADLRNLLIYGATLGAMNLSIYRAMELIPIGIAIAIEVTGPLAVALLGSRRLKDFLWIACAAVGLSLLLPLQEASSTLNPVGVAYAAAAAFCWALYIVFGKRASSLPGGQAVAWGMLVAASFTVPLGIAHAGAGLLVPAVLLIGLAVAVLSSMVPYLLEMMALRRLPSHVFGLAVSASPAVAALIGFLMLGERLSALQWAAIACIMFASAGSALGKGRREAA
ncbi:inner membrane transporter RhtA [Azospirillum lipoferum]|uniref:EamA family transporter n=1 Tax=Azospirillum TaxID=191 RepID=UPI001B3C138C|nr:MULTISPECIES: EamA family transporter [Azospirillum]MCP1613381.1 inner membrane transporter RhtA [Azospirillum lipoferum]MDW5533181.1 EamA family transporter [Azospirillum sp. NL1]